jgi:hypothetical protein
MQIGTTVDPFGHTECPEPTILLETVESEFESLKRMQYWTEASEAIAPTEKYLLFTNDAGGLNNIRLGWEASGLIAQATGRTLVLPPRSKMYLLDWGDMQRAPSQREQSGTLVEELLNLMQLKGNIPTLTAKEFEDRTGLTWRKALLQGQQLPKNQKDACVLDDYKQVQGKYLFLDGQQREGFSCMAWPDRGAPNTHVKAVIGDQGWALLNHGFVWHDDAFAIASKVVNYLGLFDYTAMHARYGDFQFHEKQQNPLAIFDKWDALIQPGTVVYLATDEPSKFQQAGLTSSLLQTNAGARIVTWDDLFKDSTGQLLVDLKQRYSEERWFKLTGPVEELICTYSKIFVGSPLSTFTGHIQRMRIHAEAPVTATLHHTDRPSMAMINTQLQLWQKLDKKSNFRPLPLNKGSVFLQISD